MPLAAPSISAPLAPSATDRVEAEPRPRREMRAGAHRTAVGWTSVWVVAAVLAALFRALAMYTPALAEHLAQPADRWAEVNPDAPSAPPAVDDATNVEFVDSPAPNADTHDSDDESAEARVLRDLHDAAAWFARSA